MTQEDVMAATEQGRAAGKNTRSFAGECPFPHTRLAMRMAWMDGFGQGREQVSEREGAEQVAERSARRSGS